MRLRSPKPGSPLVAEVGQLLANGATYDDAARHILAANSNLVAAIKTLHDAVPGLPLAEAKAIVDRNAPPR